LLPPPVPPAVEPAVPDADAAPDPLDAAVAEPVDAPLAAPVEAAARRLAEDMAVVLQAALLVRHGPPEVADAFVAARLGGAMRGCYGALPKGLSLAPVIARARVKG
jgi:putative acyl-CoA dehydrogenase